MNLESILFMSPILKIKKTPNPCRKRAKKKKNEKAEFKTNNHNFTIKAYTLNLKFSLKLV